VVYDAVGGDLFKDAMRATNPEGRILVIGFASGQMPQIAPNHLLVKNIDVIGLLLGRLHALRRGPPCRKPEGALMELYAEGRITPHIGATRPLSACVEALDLLRNRDVAGKVVVTMGD
jgi:NADPH2:quinone reductase